MQKRTALLLSTLVLVGTLLFAAAPIAADPLPAWRFTSSLAATPVNQAVAWGNYLYAFGPISPPNITVQSAQAKPNGSLGPWTAVSTITLPVSGTAGIMAAAVWGDYLYVLCTVFGGDLDQFDEVIEYAHIQPNGDFDPWQGQVLVEYGFYFEAMVAYNGNLYILGGYAPPGRVQNRVKRFPLNSNGSLGAPVTENPMFYARAEFPALVVNGYLYALWGEAPGAGGPVLHVERARIQVNGSLDTWQAVSSPPNFVRSSSAAAAFGNLVYIVGGFQDGAPLRNVERSLVGSGGSLGPLHVQPSTNVARYGLGVTRTEIFCTPWAEETRAVISPASST